MLAKLYIAAFALLKLTSVIPENVSWWWMALAVLLYLM
jgi:hypothetical protein